MNRIRSYINLSKPTIVLMVVFTGAAALAAEGSLFSKPLEMSLVLLGILFSAASANSFNQFLEREIDAQMKRTRERRPLPRGDLKPRQAVVFALACGLVGNTILAYFGSPTAVVISIATILYYVLFYTRWLKPRHYYNIVIGGVAGSTAPLIAWSAATGGSISAYAWLMFLIIFMWTPPHFWALALAVKDDYEKVKMPMLPAVKGERRTRSEIIIYTILLLPISFLPIFVHSVGWIFILGTAIFWCWYGVETWKMWKLQTTASYRRLFFVSIAYIFGVFLAMILDGYWAFIFETKVLV